ENFAGWASVPKETYEHYGSVFAMYTLVPDHLLKVKVQKLTHEFDIIQQLAETFMVTKSLINHRLWQCE
ncbi:MAG: hypothetical protein OXC40_05925, partial [Proteobacteria bacterium]|nr:hypothetical protein [Pseudomonadota bacterium]